MRSGKRNQEEEEYEDDDSSTRKEGPSSYNTNSNTKEGKSKDQKANAIRSKHSVTEQRRRSKINERFQILRDLIPHSDQKRDTASFLLEVIEYVQYLQENVQKYEGTYQGWSPEPTKLMPWRNSHWRVPSFVGHPPPLKNGSGPGSTFSGKFDESNTSITPAMLTAQDPAESDYGGDATCRTIDQLPELANKGVAMPTPLQTKSSVPVQNDSRLVHPLQRPVSDEQSTDSPTTGNTLNQQEDLMIEGGTISISSVYSQGLLNTLTQSLQNAGVDLSQANISVKIDLGKRANRQPTFGTFAVKDHENLPSSNQRTTHPREASSGDDSDQAQKRLKT